MARKPDVFDDIVLKRMKQLDLTDNPCIWLDGHDVVKLLRRYHARVRRLVRSERRTALTTKALLRKSAERDPRDHVLAEGCHAVAEHCEHLLFLLDRLKKGGK